MKIRFVHLMLICCVALCSSCATLMNKSYTSITVRTKQPLNFVVQGDTILNPSGEDFTFVQANSLNPIDFHVYDSISSRPFPIMAQKSPYYWGNVVFLPAAGVGALVGGLVDEVTGRKWVYPSRVYIDLESEKSGYLNYFPMDSSYFRLKNRISFTPFSSQEVFHPGIEFSYLRHHDTESASQITFSSLIPRDNGYSRDAEGFEIGLEHKIYLRNAQRTRLYVSANVGYLNKDYRAETTLQIPDEDLPQWQWDRFDRLVTIQKRFIDFTPRLGIEQYISKWLVFEAYTGLGLRYRNVSIPGIEENFVVENDGWFWDPVEAANDPGTRFGLNFDANFRIGIQF